LAIELGRVDIATEVSLLSSHLALPRAGHLQQAYHIFGYLKAKPTKTLAFDTQHPDIDESRLIFTAGAQRNQFRGTHLSRVGTLFPHTVLLMQTMRAIS